MWPFKPKPAPTPERPPINEDWRVGDLADCLNNEGWSNLAFGPAFRETVRVTAVVAGKDAVTGALGWGLRFAGHPHAYAANQFRKIDAPSTEIADRIRACRPVHEQVPA